MKVTLVLVTALAVAGAWLSWPSDPPMDAPVALSKLERSILSPIEMATPPTVDLAARSKHPRKPAGTTVPALDTSEWAGRLAARGDRRDLDAVIETFQDSMQCHHYHDSVELLQVSINDPRKKDLTTLSLRELAEMDNTATLEQAVIDRARTLCEGSDRAAVEQAYHLAMLDAALMGDPDAQTCFLRDGSNTRNWSSQEFQQWLAPHYLAYLGSFAEAGLERSDPYVGYWALREFVVATSVDSLVFNRRPDPVPDIVRVWQVARLASLRAPPELRLRVENMLGEADERGLIAPEDIARADAWAQATWEKEFADQPPFDFEMHGACSPDGWD